MCYKQETIRVAVGVIENDNGEILISKRQPHQHHPGLWEFPGGKIIKGESVETALSREIKEELSLSIQASRPLIQIHHCYEQYSVQLFIRKILQWTGQATGCEGQSIEWIDKKGLSQKSFLEANNNIIKAVQMPEILCITPDPEQMERDQFIETVEEILQKGVHWIQFRAKQKNINSYKDLIITVSDLVKQYDGKIILNTDYGDPMLEFVDGIHLSSDKIRTEKTIPFQDKLLMVSCHSAEEIENANKINADAIVLGSVSKTQSHPGMEGMGWNVFSKLIKKTNIPVYAVGGMKYSDLHKAWENGAQGVAMISELWSL